MNTGNKCFSFSLLLDHLTRSGDKFTQILCVSLKYKIFETLHRQSYNSIGLSKELNVPFRSIDRVLVILKSLGFIEYESGKYKCVETEKYVKYRTVSKVVLDEYYLETLNLHNSLKTGFKNKKYREYLKNIVLENDFEVLLNGIVFFKLVSVMISLDLFSVFSRSGDYKIIKRVLDFNDNDDVGLFLELLEKFEIISMNNYKIKITENGNIVKDLLQKMFMGGSVKMRNMYSNFWKEFEYSFKTGGSAFKKVYNTSLFQYFEKNKELGLFYHKCLRNESKKPNLYDINGWYPELKLDKISTICDIGGSSGECVTKFIDNFKSIQAIIIDLASAFSKKSESKRIKFVETSILEEIPSIKSDIFILRTIIHCWDTSNQKIILNNVKKLMGDSSRLFIIDWKYIDNSFNSAFCDIHTQVCYDQAVILKESEYINICNDVGLAIEKVYNISEKRNTHLPWILIVAKRFNQN